MDGFEFWWLIEQSRRDCEDGDTGGSSTGRHRYDLWGAGYILMGAMEEEDFDYFMDW